MSQQIPASQANTNRPLVTGKRLAAISLILGIINLLQLPLQLGGLQVGTSSTFHSVAGFSILICCLLGITGIVFGIVALAGARKSPDQPGRGQALVGVITNILAVLASLFFLLLFIFTVCGDCGRPPLSF
jgi:hypothetical protein